MLTALPGRIPSFVLFCAIGFMAIAQPPEGHAEVDCVPIHEKVNDAEVSAGLGDKRFGRTVCADVVAMDQMLVYNRFGAFNPFGMMYALRRDVVPLNQMPKALTADACDALLGTETSGAALSAGDVRLKDCKRPRPMVLRANVGDVLHIRMTNLLAPKQPNFSSDFCGSGKDIVPGVRGDMFPRIRTWMSEGDQTALDHGEATCAERASMDRDGDNNWPAERGMNFAIQGLTAFAIEDGKVVEAPRYCKGLSSIAPDETKDCYYMIEREGPFFLASTAAPSGGEGDGGSITHGLFGAVVAQNSNARAYRSQTTHGAFNAVWKQTDTPRHAVDSVGNLGAYETTDPQGIPILNVWRDTGDRAFEVVHADLNAIVHQPAEGEAPSRSFRKFSVFFHDELKTFVKRNFEELGDFATGQLAGVRDGFAINYGTGGMGAMLLATARASALRPIVSSACTRSFS